MSPGQCSAQMVARILLLEVQEHKDWAAFLDWLPEQGPINLFSLLRSSAPQWVADFRFNPICPYDPIRLLLLRLSSKGAHHLFRARHDMAFQPSHFNDDFRSPIWISKNGGILAYYAPNPLFIVMFCTNQNGSSAACHIFLSDHFHFTWH